MTDSLQKKLSKWKQSTADSDNLSENFKIGYVLAISAAQEAVRDCAKKIQAEFDESFQDTLGCDYRVYKNDIEEKIRKLLVGSSKEDKE